MLIIVSKLVSSGVGEVRLIIVSKLEQVEVEKFAY